MVSLTEKNYTKFKGNKMTVIIGLALWLTFTIGLIWGWVLNIIWIFNQETLITNGETIISIIGVLLAPIGAIMGLFVH